MKEYINDNKKKIINRFIRKNIHGDNINRVIKVNCASLDFDYPGMDFKLSVINTSDEIKDKLLSEHNLRVNSDKNFLGFFCSDNNLGSYINLGKDSSGRIRSKNDMISLNTKNNTLNISIHSVFLITENFISAVNKEYFIYDANDVIKNININKKYYILVVYNGMRTIPYLRILDHNPYEYNNIEEVLNAIYDIYSKDCIYNSIYTTNLEVRKEIHNSSIIKNNSCIDGINLDRISPIIDKLDKESIIDIDDPITKYNAINGLSAVFECKTDENTGDQYYDYKYYIKDILIDHSKVHKTKSGDTIDQDTILDFYDLYSPKDKSPMIKSDIPDNVYTKFYNLLEILKEKNYIEDFYTNEFYYYEKHYNDTNVYILYAECTDFGEYFDGKYAQTVRMIKDKVVLKVFNNSFGAIYVYDSDNDRYITTVIDFDNYNTIFEHTIEYRDQKLSKYKSDICEFESVFSNSLKEIYYYNSSNELYIDKNRLVSKIFSNEDEYVYMRDKFGVPFKYYLKKR